MNSPPRNTFGIINPRTGQRYNDILSSHLELRRLQIEEWLIEGVIAESRDRKKEYRVLLNFATQRLLLREGIIDVLVSFQRRKEGNYAICRIWDATKSRQQQQKEEDSEYETI